MGVCCGFAKLPVFLSLEVSTLTMNRGARSKIRPAKALAPSLPPLTEASLLTGPTSPMVVANGHSGMKEGTMIMTDSKLIIEQQKEAGCLGRSTVANGRADACLEIVLLASGVRRNWEKCCKGYSGMQLTEDCCITIILQSITLS